MSVVPERLVADIGGTHSRFALARPGERPRAVRTLLNREHASLAAAAQNYLEAEHATPASACFAVAAPVREGEMRLVNYPWTFSAAALTAALGLKRLRLVNDFEAIAHSLPALAPDELVALGGGCAEPGAVQVVLGPGTGLGVAQLVPCGTGVHVLATEGGHASIGARDAAELALITELMKDGAYLCRESLLCGAGLERIHAALHALAGETAPHLDAAEIQRRAVAGDSTHAVAALGHFCALLGTAAGDQALASGARGGVFLAGGILPRFIDFVRASRFRARFEDKGPMSDYVRRIPTWLIRCEHPGLLGAARVPD
jgi:glucokinase